MSPTFTYCPHCGIRLTSAIAAVPSSAPPAHDDTAAVSVDDVRTGLTPAMPGPPGWTTIPTDEALTLAGTPAPAPAADVTVASDVTAATVMGRLDDAATIAGPTPPRPAPPRPASKRRFGTHLEGSTPAPAAPPPPAIPHMNPGDAFGTRYRITKMLGVGGMGAVYQAWDSELGVTVAIKTIRPGVGTDASTALDAERRFKRELLLARQVTHPNVVRIYDLGEIEGTKYITMSFVDGEDLASILSREGKLPPVRALPIMRQVMAGMGAAHLAGIVHRDLKPANIMVDQSGLALVMDFGIARSVDGPPDPTPAAGSPKLEEPARGHAMGSATAMPTHALTVAGSVMGTLDYMAPEQARGEAVDQRADVYALGLILRDVLLGRTARPKTGRAVDDLKQRIAEPLPTARSVDEAIPEPLDAVISRALALDSAERYQTSQELADALNALDDEGTLKPVYKRLTRPMMATAAAGVALLVGATWYFARGPEIPVEHDPVAVLIADFQNQTGDPTFDRSLEPVMKLALEGAGFISAFDRSAIPRTLGVPAPDVLDETTTRELAVKQGVGVVVSGTLTKTGNRFAVSVKAAEAVTGNVIANENDTASGKENVLGVVTSLANDVREALGDDSSDTAKRFAMETLSATSLDVVREYAISMEALSRSRFNEALQGFSRAVALDPKFGMAYAGMAIASNNMGRTQDAEKYVKQAYDLVDGMTERERFRTRGLLYLITNDYQSCVREYGDLIARYSADASARNNRALCLSYLRDMPTAVEEMRQVVRILPNRGLYRLNLATFSAYSGDGPGAETLARSAMELTPYGLQALAFAQALQGKTREAADSYRQFGEAKEVGPSPAASGLADLALYEGRFSEAVRLFTEGASADVAEMESDRAALKLAGVAYTELLRGRRPAAIAAAEKALATSPSRTARFLAARVLVEAGESAKAKPIAIGLGNDLQPDSQAMASIIDGMIARADGDFRNAVRFLTEANTQLDTWIGHFELGRAYLAAGAFPQADSEFERCINRRGEAMALFLDEEPTFGYFPMVYYYQGLVREGLKSARVVESYRAYLDIRGASGDDPLVAELRQRIATP